MGFIGGWGKWIGIVWGIGVGGVGWVEYMSCWGWEWGKWRRGLVKNGRVSGEGVGFGCVLLVIYFVVK